MIADFLKVRVGGGEITATDISLLHQVSWNLN